VIRSYFVWSLLVLIVVCIYPFLEIGSWVGTELLVARCENWREKFLCFSLFCLASMVTCKESDGFRGLFI
jgi:hypothetical protein